MFRYLLSRLCSLVLLLLGVVSCSPEGEPALHTPFPYTPNPSSTPAPSATSITVESTDVPSATSTLLPTAQVMLTPTPPACGTRGGKINTYQLSAQWLRYPLDVRVYQPPCYDEQPERAYPALYLIHGQSFTDDQWERLGVGEVADRLIGQGELAPFLIVMPRDREWTQSDKDPFGRAFIELLLPWVDQTFRTLPERSARAVGGLSRGAGWAIHFGLKHWETFGAIGAHSPAVFWSDTPLIPAWLGAIPPDSLPRFYIDLGDRDRQEITESAAWFEDQLLRQNVVHEWHLFHGEHNENYWRAHLELYLRWYAAPWIIRQSP